MRKHFTLTKPKSLIAATKNVVISNNTPRSRSYVTFRCHSRYSLRQNTKILHTGDICKETIFTATGVVPTRGALTEGLPTTWHLTLQMPATAPNWKRQSAVLLSSCDRVKLPFLIRR